MFTRRQFGLTGVGAAVVGLGNETAARAAGTFPVAKSDAEWRGLLSKDQYYVLRKHGTERAGSSPLDKTYEHGTYHCAGCEQPLFSSGAKFNSGTGWPSFYAPLNAAVETSTDYLLVFARTEVHCSNCGGHLGHVFEDGPKPTGLRYCINGVALKFIPGATGM